MSGLAGILGIERSAGLTESGVIGIDEPPSNRKQLGKGYVVLVAIAEV